VQKYLRFGWPTLNLVTSEQVAPMMTVLRYLLLIVTAITFIGLNLILTLSEIGHNPLEWVVICFLWIGLALNFFYLIMSSPKTSEWRLFRLITLWFDAKENELRSRVKRAAPPPE
jgi:hypothetical protein